LRRIKMVLGVAAAMAMMLVAFVAPAMAQTNEFNDSERYGFVVSDDSDWNDHNDYYPFYNAYSYYDDEYLDDLEDAYEDYEDEVEDYLEDYEGSYWEFDSYYW
jgi:hypothetical protein